MKNLLRPIVWLVALAATAAVVAASATGGTAPASPRLLVSPSWLHKAETLTLNRVFGGARPVHTVYIPYPRKIAVVFEFDRVVICGACSAPSNASLPRGRVIRVSYDRTTHRQGGAKDGIAMQFCEARNGQPPRSLCLRH
jgi:hypothetical protein